MANIKIVCPRCHQPFNGLACRCGFQAEPVTEYGMALPAYTLLHDRYIFQRVIGAGGFGITYQATDILNKAVCAVKEYVPVGIAVRDADWQLVPDAPAKRLLYYHARERFLEEAQMLKKLSYIPETVFVTDYFYENNTAYFVMEYIDGVTLRALVSSRGALGQAQTQAILQAAGNALERIHTDAGVFHRDISPENIMITNKGTVKLIDFGSAKDLARQSNQLFTIVLKAGYAPPEQYSATTPQGRYTDVYALAGTAYFLLSGRVPPDAPARVNGTPCPALKTLGLGVSDQVSDAVERALTLSRKDRTQTVAEFLRQLGCGGKEAPAAHVSAWVELTAGAARQRWRLQDNVTVTAGRQARSSQLVLPEDPKLSKAHVLLCYDADQGQFLVKDISTNGVHADGQRLEPGRLYQLPPGTVLSLAGGVCELKLGVG